MLDWKRDLGTVLISEMLFVVIVWQWGDVKNNLDSKANDCFTPNKELKITSDK